jgi:hypothetical protein
MSNVTNNQRFVPGSSLAAAARDVEDTRRKAYVPPHPTDTPDRYRARMQRMEEVLREIETRRSA